MLKGVLAFSLATLISRVLGLLRDMILASTFGASKELDAYMIAILFPFFLRRIFAEGAMNSSLVPLYKTRDDKDHLVSSVINFMGILSLSITVLVMAYPSIVPGIMGMGLSQETRRMVEDLVRITAPFSIFITLWAVGYAVLNSHGEYFLPALTPAFVNVGVILGTVFGRTTWSALGFTLGSASACVILLSRSLSHFEYRPVFKPDGEFLSLFLKATGAVAVSQVNLLVDANVASFLENGSISVLQFASRLYQLPMGLFGVAVSTVALSEMSGSEDSEGKLREALDRVAFLIIPSTFGIVALSESLIDLVYGWGNFSRSSVALTSLTLVSYSIGLPAYSFLYVLMRYRHSLKDMNLPLRVTWLTAGLNSILDPIFAHLIGVSGIALATSVSGYVGLVYMLKKSPVSIFSKEILKVSISGFLMWISLNWIPPGKITGIMGTVSGLFVYSMVCLILKCEGLSEVVGIIRRRR